MGLAVNILCRNFRDDRVIPRFSRYLRDCLGWNLTARPDPAADIIYLSGYFEAQLLKPWPAARLAAYFTHIETQPPGNAKAKLYEAIAKRVDLRIATAAMYAKGLTEYGPTVQIRPPVERHRFVPPPRPPRGGRNVMAGFSGYTYSNRRKGEDLARALLTSKIGQAIEWRASGRGWPVPTKKYNWSEMPGFYQSLDVLVVTSMVEGVPMPPLEVLSCGGSVVIPRGVGLLDELPDTPGIHRYPCGDANGAVKALQAAVKLRPEVNREALRAVTEPYTIYGWCEQHHHSFSEVFC